jgi:hypothetical protein
MIPATHETSDTFNYEILRGVVTFGWDLGVNLGRALLLLSSHV